MIRGVSRDVLRLGIVKITGHAKRLVVSRMQDFLQQYQLHCSTLPFYVHLCLVITSVNLCLVITPVKFDLINKPQSMQCICFCNM